MTIQTDGAIGKDPNSSTGQVITTPDIDGGTIDNTPIGLTTPLAGSFTTLKMTTGAAAAVVVSDGSGNLVADATPALGTPSSGALDNCTSDTAADNDSSTQLATTAFAKSQDAVLARDPNQSVALTAAASGSSGITVADNDNIDFGAGNFALVWKGSLPDWTPSAMQILLTKNFGATSGVRLQVNATTGAINQVTYDGNQIDHVSTVSPSIPDNGIAEIVSVVTANSSVVIYVNGVQLGDSIACGAFSASGATALYILGHDDGRYAGTCIHAYTLNFAPTAAEVLDMFRNSIPESWKWGSQTSIITGTDSTFAGASNWANTGSIASYDETTGGVLTIAADTAGQYCDLPVLNATTVVGKRYRLEFDVTTLTATWTIKDFARAVTIGTISATGANQKIEFTATATGGLSLVAVGTTSATVLDNFLLYEIGATLALCPENILPDRWLDASTNALHASYPAAGCTLTRPWSYANLQAAANNAGAAGLTIPVPVGGLYRTDADPSVICVRTA